MNATTFIQKLYPFISFAPGQGEEKKSYYAVGEGQQGQGQGQQGQGQGQQGQSGTQPSNPDQKKNM